MSKLVAISAASTDGLESVIDPRFGRAFAYIIVDVDTNAVVAQLDNTLREAAHGAGTGAAALLSKNSVIAVISGRFGPKASQALGSFGIEMCTVEKDTTVKDAVASYVSGGFNQKMNVDENSCDGAGGGRGMGGGGGSGMGGGGGSGMGGGQSGGRGMGGGGGRGMGGGGGRGMGGGQSGGRGMGNNRGGGRGR